MANFFTRHFNFLSSEEPTRELEAIFDTFAEKAAFKKLAIYIATDLVRSPPLKKEDLLI